MKCVKMKQDMVVLLKDYLTGILINNKWVGFFPLFYFTEPKF